MGRQALQIGFRGALLEFAVWWGGRNQGTGNHRRRAVVLAGKSGLGSRTAVWVQPPGREFTSCVTLGRCLGFSETYRFTVKWAC